MENSITSVEPSPNPETDGTSAAAVHVPRYSYYALTVLTLVNFLNYIDRQVLPAVAPAMRKELGLSQTEIGFLEDALLLSYVVLALVFGRLGDRYSRTKLMAAAAAVWSLATVGVAVSFADSALHRGVVRRSAGALRSTGAGRGGRIILFDNHADADR
jgi:MFS family permease